MAKPVPLDVDRTAQIIAASGAALAAVLAAFAKVMRAWFDGRKKK